MSNLVKCFKASCSRWALIGVAVTAAGCVTHPPKPVEPVDWRASWNASVAGLDRIRLRGQIQVQWADEDGAHREQGDLDALLDGDSRISLRVTKFGDVMLWLGSTPAGSWMFDLTASPTTLTSSGPDDARGQPLLPPPVLRLVLGLDPWPAETARDQTMVGLVLKGALSGGTFTATLEPGTLRPLEVRFQRDDIGTVVGTHRWTTGVVHVAPGTRVLARVVDVQSGDTLLKFRTAKAQVILPDQMTRLAAVWFDVDRIASHLKPEVVE